MNSHGAGGARTHDRQIMSLRAREKLVSFFENLGVEGNRVTNAISAEKVVGEDRVVFEDHWSGEFFGQPTEGPDAIAIIAAGGKVIASTSTFSPPPTPAGTTGRARGAVCVAAWQGGGCPAWPRSGKIVEYVSICDGVHLVVQKGIRGTGRGAP